MLLDNVNNNSITMNDSNPCNIIYKQFAEQNLSMLEAVLTNCEKCEVMEVNIDDQLTEVSIVPIQPDGNCLYSTILHQLDGIETKSSQHIERTGLLRKQVVQHIKNNEGDFKSAIMGNIIENPEFNIDGDMDKSCADFVRRLASDGFWGGSESILAVSQIYRVKIVVFAEKKEFYMPIGFNCLYNRSLFLAYRLGVIGGKISYIHYDSICGINESILYKCAQKFAKCLNFGEVDLTM